MADTQRITRNGKGRKDPTKRTINSVVVIPSVITSPAKSNDTSNNVNRECMNGTEQMIVNVKNKTQRSTTIILYSI